MDKLKQKQRLRELKLLESKLQYSYNLNRQFRRIYESTNKNKDDKKDKFIIISDSENKNIFSGIPKDLIQFLDSVGHFNKDIFDVENDNISIGNYYELIETVKYLIDILEFDLMNSFAESNGLPDLKDFYEE
jgi:hypothetical protein